MDNLQATTALLSMLYLQIKRFITDNRRGGVA